MLRSIPLHGETLTELVAKAKKWEIPHRVGGSHRSIHHGPSHLLIVHNRSNNSFSAAVCFHCCNGINREIEEWEGMDNIVVAGSYNLSDPDLEKKTEQNTYCFETQVYQDQEKCSIQDSNSIQAKLSKKSA